MSARAPYRIAGILPLLPLLALLAGCATARPAPRPAAVSHFVLFKLADPADVDAFIADCDGALATIPGVVSYACGRHLDTGRPAVDGTYDVACYLGFATAADYEAYLVHPEHERLVRTWRDRFAWMRIYDVLDETP